MENDNLADTGENAALVEYVLMMAQLLLALLVPPQEMENTQHTPKEEAQVPEAVPPLLVHSEQSGEMENEKEFLAARAAL